MRPCSCKDIEILQSELYNADALRAELANKAVEFKALGHDTSQVAFSNFQKNPGIKLDRVPAGKDVSVGYHGHGEQMSEDAWHKYTNAQLCERTQESADSLNDATTFAACKTISDAIRNHEDLHLARCNAVGFRAYLAMSGSAHALEEVEAYQGQVETLRAELYKQLKSANISVTFRHNPSVPGMGDVLIGELASTHVFTERFHDIQMEASGHLSFDRSLPICTYNGLPAEGPVAGYLRFERGNHVLAMAITQEAVFNFGVVCSGMPNRLTEKQGNTIGAKFAMPLKDGELAVPPAYVMTSPDTYVLHMCQ